jgi:adenine deaminase
MVVFSDLNNLQAEMVFRDGVLAAQNGQIVMEKPPQRKIDLRDSMNARPDDMDFSITANGTRIHVIGGLADQVVTGPG